MDTEGNLYANEEGRKHIDELLEAKLRDATDDLKKVRDLKDAPKDGIRIESEKVLQAVLMMNRHQRRVFFSERRRGASEEEALCAAEVSR